MKKLLTILLLLPSLVYANLYYFSNAGSDANNGTSQATSWQTISKFNSFGFVSGDEVYFKMGDVFYGSIVPKNGVKIGSYGAGNKPIITGLSDAIGWTSTGTNIWESAAISVGQSTAMIVTVNGVSIPMGRWPNGWRTYNASGSTLTDAQGTPPSNFTGGTLVIRKNQYSIQKGTITAQSGSTYTYSQFPGQSYGTSNGYGYFVQNHRSTLDIQNEWYWNGSKLSIYSTTIPVNVKVSTVTSVIDLTNKNGVSISNLVIRGSVYDLVTMNGASNCELVNCDLDAAGNCGVWGNSFSNCKIQNCTISNINNFGIFSASVSNTGNVITNNTVTNCGVNPGMTDQGGHTIVESAGGILCFGGVNISNNVVRKTGYANIYFKGSNVLVKNNYCDSSCLTKDESSSIYSYVGKADGTTYSNQIVDGNIVLNAVGATGGKTSGPVAAGIYMDINVKGVQIINNSIAHCATYGILLQDNQNDQVKNNTVYDCNSSSLGMWTDASGAVPTRGVNITGNVFVMKTTSTSLGNLSYQTNESSVTAFGSSDNNVIATPLNDVNAWFTAAAGVYNHRTLAQWVSVTGQDAHSTKSPVAITDPNKLRFEYNASSSFKIVNLGSTYTDMKGIQVSSLTLNPYSSTVLILTGGAPPPVTFSNAAISSSFIRNNCPAGSTGGVVIYSVPAGKYTSTVSQVDANGKALADISANGQSYANTNGVCTDTTTVPTYFNVSKSQSFTRNNCPTGSTGSQVVYTVAAGKYSSTVSQADADNKATQDINNNGQANANTNGICTASPPPPPPPVNCSWWDKLFRRKGCHF